MGWARCGFSSPFHSFVDWLWGDLLGGPSKCTTLTFFHAPFGQTQRSTWTSEDLLTVAWTRDVHPFPHKIAPKFPVPRRDRRPCSRVWRPTHQWRRVSSDVRARDRSKREGENGTMINRQRRRYANWRIWTLFLLGEWWRRSKV